MKWKERSVWIFFLAVSLILNGLVPVSLFSNSEGKYHHLFSTVLFYLKNIYVTELQEKDLMIGAIRGMFLATNDPYTRFLDREEHKEFSGTEKGKKAGIGVEVTLENGVPVVIAPIEGGPAEKAGIRAGDRILAIDGQSLKHLTFGEMLKLISGELGTVVTLNVLHRDTQKSEDIQVVRGVFKLEYCRGEIIADGKIGYIRLSHFFGSDSGITDQFRKLLVSFKKEKVSGIVVDLRNNAGGHLDMAVEISGYFLKKGDLVVTAKGRNSSNNKIYKAKGKTKVVPENIPVAVLINQGSASASEILAGALQDHKRAKLIGNRSFGKGSVQQIVRPLPDDTAALITIQKYFTPKDRSIHGKGLEPDIKIDPILPTEDDRYYHSKMIKSSFFQKFKKEHPVYDTRLKKIFLESAKQAGYHFTEPFALVLLKNSYPDEKKGLTDSETDVQLAAAVRELLQN